MFARWFLASYCFASCASAATFCVNTVAEFQSALTTAESNGQNDVILVEPGIYLVIAPLHYYTAENYDLSVSGGWEACMSHHNDPAFTVIDGQSGSALAHFTGALNRTGNISVSWLTFRNGIGSDSLSSVSLGYAGGWQGVLSVQNNVFTRLEGSLTSGYTAIQLDSDQGEIHVSNNVFGHNVTDNGTSPVDLIANGTAFAYVGTFNNNTVSANVSSGGSGVRIGGSGIWSVANNVFWNNFSDDLLLGAQYVFLSNNDIGTYSGTPVNQSGNVSVDPGFVVADANYRLRGDSPLINAGRNNAPYGIGTYDIAGAPRMVFGTVDIGAYELQDKIFAADFD